MPPRRVTYPTVPALSAALVAAPELLAAGDEWDGVLAGAGTVAEADLADVSLVGSRWGGAELVGRRFPGLVCRDTRFERCDLAGAVLDDAGLTRVVFEGCRLTGAVFGGSRLTDVAFVDCVMDDVDLRMATLRRVEFDRCRSIGADLYGSTATHVRFSGCDLSRANLDGMTATELDLRGSTLDGIRGAVSVAGARITVEQVLPLGAALVGSLGFVVD